MNLASSFYNGFHVDYKIKIDCELAEEFKMKVVLLVDIKSEI